MEIDLFLDVGMCGAVCFAELVIGLVATRTGRFIVIATKIAGLILDFSAMYSSDGFNTYLFALLVWERFMMIYLIIWYFVSLILLYLLYCITCGCWKKVKKKLEEKKENSILTLPLAYKEYIELRSEKYKEPQKNCCIALDQDGMKKGLITLYYGALFNTTDYLGAIWKSDNSKWGCFFVAYFFSIFYISFFGMFVIIYSMKQSDPVGTRVAVGMSLYLNALGAFQHWFTLSHGIYEKCLLRKQIKKELELDGAIQNAEKRKTSKDVETGTVELEVKEATDPTRKGTATLSEKRRAQVVKRMTYTSKSQQWKEKCCCGLYWLCCLCILCGIRDCGRKCAVRMSRGCQCGGCCCKYFGKLLGWSTLLIQAGMISYGIIYGWVYF